MNSDQIKGQWLQIEGEAKRTWAKLTDNDWKLAAGDIEKLAGRIQERYGDAKEVVMGQIGKLLQRVSESAKKAAGHPADALQTTTAGAAVGKSASGS